MEFRAVGRTGLSVSAVGLGTMTWGRDTDDVDAADQLVDFVDAGGNLLDTAASYGDGAAEAQIGDLLSRVVDRADVVLCTKGGVRRRGARFVVDASRGNMLASLDASLRRLRTDHVDLWLLQTPDYHTPLDETLSALKIAVDSGRTRYVGLANHPAWLTAQTATELRHLGIELAAAEMEYSLLQRGIERELVPAARALGFGVIGWSPLGRGVLTGKYRHSIPADSRAASAHLAGFVQPYLTTWAADVVEAVVTAAEGLSCSPLDVALAWARDGDQVASVIAGARTAAQLRATLRAAEMTLPDEIIQALDEVSAFDVGYPERL